MRPETTMKLLVRLLATLLIYAVVCLDYRVTRLEELGKASQPASSDAVVLDPCPEDQTLTTLKALGLEIKCKGWDSDSTLNHYQEQVAVGCSEIVEVRFDGKAIRKGKP